MTAKITFPYDQSFVKEVELITKNDLEEVLITAQHLFSDRSNWLLAYQRIEILEKAATIMKE